MDITRRWEFLIQETVGEDNLIRLPRPVKKSVGTNHAIKGASIFWNINKASNHLVFSERELQKDQYIPVGRYEIYGIESLSEDGGRIRVPSNERFNELWEPEPRSGDRMFFLAHKAMQSNENSSAFLLTERQLLGILPRQPITENAGRGATPKGVFSIPGFSGTN